jgi:agmatinase
MMKIKKMNLPFTGFPSFCKMPIWEDWSSVDADVAILGIPFDMSTQAKPGARYGPRGIREASTLDDASYYDFEFDEINLEGVRIVDCGDVDMIHMDPQQNLVNSYDAVREIGKKGALMVILGGDHAVTIPVVRALKDRGPFHIIQFDAHLDFCDERFGVREGQGNPMRRVSEMAHVSGITQIGIRGPGSSNRQDFEDAKAYGSTIIGSREFRQIGSKGILERIPKDVKYYITIDCDVLNPALAPGTGSPTPGGLDYYDLTDTLIGIAACGDVIGLDFCEVAPMYDLAGITAMVASRTIVELLAAVFSKNR